MNLHAHSVKKFLRRNGPRVPEEYLFSPEDLKQMRRIKQLFNQFDANKNGKLDEFELSRLYTHHGVPLSPGEIRLLFGQPHIDFNVNFFVAMTGDKSRLRTFRARLNELKTKVQNCSTFHLNRTYLPSTFDQMMEDFSNRQKRNRLHAEFEKVCAGLINEPVES